MPDVHHERRYIWTYSGDSTNQRLRVFAALVAGTVVPTNHSVDVCHESLDVCRRLTASDTEVARLAGPTVCSYPFLQVRVRCAVRADVVRRHPAKCKLSTLRLTLNPS